ncbi:hypothetical protein EXIGLDRAFT_266118 [Exidia glandulosa HHB12029]|uniref:Uncharacterized protein n=1 Tax=Exidia glandulosa HHB12029 TaxID=1314781 RepID=A0A165MA38_EXIGL|nr:hypothetical protein EXIGLDRAFT_266118 [Exidia glandulosa HHB12029]
MTIMMSDPLPPFLKRSPAGLIVADVPAFLASQHADPVSSHPSRRRWLTPGEDLAELFAAQPTFGSILVFNKTRDVQRICPICYRLYAVGEGVVGLDPDVVEEGSKFFEEQEGTGICSSTCARTAAADDRDGEEVSREEHPTTAMGLSGMRVITPPHELDAIIGGRKMHFVLPGQHIPAEKYCGDGEKDAHGGPAVVWENTSLS